MDTGITGRTALVCGASGGLGRAVAGALDAEGCHVVLVARRAALLEELASGLRSALPVPVDLTEPQVPQQVVDRAVEAFGAVDVLVLNGGGPPAGSAAELGTEAFGDAVHQLFLQQQRLVAAVLAGMRERGWGRVLAIGSTGVQQPIEGLALSNAGRGALSGYLKTLAAEVAADGVTVNMVLPGRIETDRSAALDRSVAERTGLDAAEVRTRSAATIPARRYGRPEEFAAVVAFLASAQASYVTGEQVRCDGGMVRAY